MLGLMTSCHIVSWRDPLDGKWGDLLEALVTYTVDGDLPILNTWV